MWSCHFFWCDNTEITTQLKFPLYDIDTLICSTEVTFLIVMKTKILLISFSKFFRFHNMGIRKLSVAFYFMFRLLTFGWLLWRIVVNVKPSVLRIAFIKFWSDCGAINLFLFQSSRKPMYWSFFMEARILLTLLKTLYFFQKITDFAYSQYPLLPYPHKNIVFKLPYQ